MTPLTHTLRAWNRASDHALSSLVEANRATLAAFGVPNDTTNKPGAAVENGKEAEEEPSDSSILHEREPWESDRTVDDAEQISVGDVVTFAKSISERDVRTFAHASGDTNRLHLDEAFAVETRFGDRIVHGTLVSGLISAALARIPGVTIYLGQDLEFVGPVAIGDRLTASVEVVEDLGGGRYRLETVVENEDGVVVDGEAVVMVDDVPGADSSEYPHDRDG